MDDGNQKKFDNFLAWLDPNRDLAATRYVTIRGGLVKYFSRKTCHGDFNCPHAEDLADETLDRVISKMDEVSLNNGAEPERRIFTFAKYLRLEHHRQPQFEPFPSDFVEKPSRKSGEAIEKEAESRCFDECLGELPFKDQRLVTEYFGHSGKERSRRRQQQADDLGITLSNLRTTTCRMRKKLEECLRNCLNK